MPKICLKRSFSVVLVHFDIRHSTQVSYACAQMPTRRHFVILNSRMNPEPQELFPRHILTYLHHIWALFWPKSTWNALFNRNFEHRMIIFEAFGRIYIYISLKSAYLVSLGNNKAQQSKKLVKICLQRPFSGVWLKSGTKIGLWCINELKPPS